MAYLAEPSVMGLGLQAAGKLVAMYWLGALVGRLLGGFILRLAKPGRVLTTFAAGAISLIILSAVTTGALSGWALLLVGFCNSLIDRKSTRLNSSHSCDTRMPSSSGKKQMITMRINTHLI